MSSRRRARERGTIRLDLTVQTAVASPGLPRKPALRRWLAAALDRDACITVRYVGTAEGRRLNLAYRGRDYATNVLSFGYGADAGGHTEGDIVLCAPVVRREARAQKKTLTAHVAHLTVHGALHLQGYDHAKSRAAVRMETLEKEILAALGFADPYADKA